VESNKYNVADRILRVDSVTLRKMEELMNTNNPQKIQAIKLLRAETKCGLKEAKQAVEKKFQSNSYTPNSEAFDIKPLVTIKSILVNFGDGDVSLSLEDLHMMTLVNMTQLGIDETRRILDLYDLICKWEGFNNEREDSDGAGS
jgi:hypothetical protein